ncbi:MAG: polyhydroxyalkanoate synthesis regulator DNA-binding domain-containing protein [Myxococcaceae bacterium]
MLLIKKYSNRRLYDTDDSRYITMEELTQKIRFGSDVRVVDAKTNEDLTQATLVQIILEGEKGRLLPSRLLTQLIRLEDDALAEFFNSYMTSALEMYLQAKSGVQALSPWNPFAQMTNPLGRFLGGFGAPQPTPSASAPSNNEDMAQLRRELDELKRSVRKKKR